MKKFWKKALALVMGTTMLFGMTACGGDGGDGGDGKVTIIVPDLVTSNEGLDGWTKSRQQQFAADYPNIKVDYRNNPTASPDKNVQAMISNLSNEKAAYTLLVANSNTYARTVYRSGLTENIASYMTAEDLADYNPTVLQGYYDGDQLVGLPFRQEFPLLGFNRKHLQSDYVKQAFGQAYNFDPTAADANAKVEEVIDNIKTWDDFKAVTKLLSGTYEVKGKGTLTVSGYGGYLIDYYIGTGVWNIANGYNSVTQHADGRIDVDLTNTQTVETVEFLQSLVAEGAMTHDPGLLFNDFFQNIYQHKIASFIYYPSWATSQFIPNGIGENDVKVINVPYGPSIAALKEQAKTDSTVVVPNTNANFSLGYVLNSRASEEQKQAAITYIKYMYGHEATLSKFEYANDFGVSMFTVPAFNFDDDYLNTTVFANVPNDWKGALTNSVKNSFVINQNYDQFFVTYVASAIPNIVGKVDKNGAVTVPEAYNTREKLVDMLDYLTDTIYSQSLGKYNNDVTNSNK